MPPPALAAFTSTSLLAAVPTEPARAVVRAALRITVTSSPRQGEIERETMHMMEGFYATKCLRQIAAFEGDGFFVAAPPSDPQVNVHGMLERAPLARAHACASG